MTRDISDATAEAICTASALRDSDPPALIDQLAAIMGPSMALVVDGQGRVVEVRRVRAEVLQ